MSAQVAGKADPCPKQPGAVRTGNGGVSWCGLFSCLSALVFCFLSVKFISLGHSVDCPSPSASVFFGLFPRGGFQAESCVGRFQGVFESLLGGTGVSLALRQLPKEELLEKGGGSLASGQRVLPIAAVSASVLW